MCSYILYGHTYSTTLVRIVQCFLELGLEHDKDFKVEPLEWETVFTDEYAMAHQPFKQMPYFVDKEVGIELYESRSVIKYVAAKLGSSLHVIGDPIKVARYETACSIELANFNSFTEGLGWELMFKQMFMKQDPEQKIVDHFNWMLNSRLEGYERLLSKQKYLAGDQLTLADMFHVPNGHIVLKVKQAQALVNADGKSPNLARWWKETSERPNYAKSQEILQAIPSNKGA